MRLKYGENRQPHGGHPPHDLRPKALIGSGGYFPEDVADVMETMASGEYNIASIITHEFPRKDLPQALELAGHPDQSLNVVIRYDG